MRSEFQAAIAQLIAEKGLPREVVMETVATALLAAYRKSFGGGENVRIEVDKNGEVHVWAAKRVVAQVNDANEEISLAGQSAGTYDHYFHLFLPPADVLWSFLKVIVFSVVIILIHCYYGYTARGGPAGVGVAVGRAVRAAIVIQTLLDFFLSLAIWGSTTTVRLAG